jgi:hypothetical protein
MAEDFWGILVPTLVGKVFYTLADRHEFWVEEMGDHHLLIVTTTGHRHRLARQEVEGAWEALTQKGTLTGQQIKQEFSEFGAPYVDALLAQMPGVEVSLNPITLSYREEK